jgi:hypothetical protein
MELILSVQNSGLNISDLVFGLLRGASTGELISFTWKISRAKVGYIYACTDEAKVSSFNNLKFVAQLLDK